MSDLDKPASGSTAPGRGRTDTQTARAAFALSRRTRFVYLSSNGETGYPQTRVLFNLLSVRAEAVETGAAALPRTFANWIATNSSSRKAAEIRRDPRVCLYYSDTETFEGLSVTGVLEEIHDSEIRRAIYIPEWDMYYYGGIDGGDFALFRFVPKEARYYHGLNASSFDASQLVLV